MTPSKAHWSTLARDPSTNIYVNLPNAEPGDIFVIFVTISRCWHEFYCLLKSGINSNRASCSRAAKRSFLSRWGKQNTVIMSLKLAVLSQCFAYPWQCNDICLDNAHLRLSVIFLLHIFHSLLTYFSKFAFKVQEISMKSSKP